MDILDEGLGHYIYYKKSGFLILGTGMISGHNNAGIQDKIKKNKVIIDTIRHILMI